MPPPSLDRLQKLMSLGANPPNDVNVILDDLLGEMRRRGVREEQLTGVELTVRTAFRLGEKNAAMKIARGEELSP